MNQEISHIAQWQELTARAENFRLEVTFDADAFYLWGPRPARPAGVKLHWTIGDPEYDRKKLGQYLTLADLRAGISDYVAGERAAGRLNR